MFECNNDDNSNNNNNNNNTCIHTLRFILFPLFKMYVSNSCFITHQNPQNVKIMNDSEISERVLEH